MQSHTWAKVFWWAVGVISSCDVYLKSFRYAVSAVKSQTRGDDGMGGLESWNATAAALLPDLLRRACFRVACLTHTRAALTRELLCSLFPFFFAKRIV